MTAFPLVASCTCGAAEVRFRRPIARAHCHCSICQRVNRAPFGDPVVFWRWDVQLSRGAEHLRWKRTRRLPLHVNRGVCAECDQLLIEHVAFSPLSIVIGTTWNEPEALPPVSGHMFYESRVADVDDPLPKHTGYLPSQLAFTGWLARRLVRGQASSVPGT